MANKSTRGIIELWPWSIRFRMHHKHGSASAEQWASHDICKPHGNPSNPPAIAPWLSPKNPDFGFHVFLGDFQAMQWKPSGFTEPPIIREVVPTILMKRLRGSTGCKTVKHVFSLFSTVFSIGETLLFSIVFNGVFNGLLVQLVHCFSISVFVFFSGFCKCFPCDSNRVSSLWAFLAKDSSATHPRNFKLGSSHRLKIWWNMFWLVVDLPLWKMMEFVSWDGYSQYTEKYSKIHVPNHQLAFVSQQNDNPPAAFPRLAELQIAPCLDPGRETTIGGNNMDYFPNYLFPTCGCQTCGNPICSQLSQILAINNLLVGSRLQGVLRIYLFSICLRTVVLSNFCRGTMIYLCKACNQHGCFWSSEQLWSLSWIHAIVQLSQKTCFMYLFELPGFRSIFSVATHPYFWPLHQSKKRYIHLMFMSSRQPHPSPHHQWIGLRENSQETIDFPCPSNFGTRILSVSSPSAHEISNLLPGSTLEMIPAWTAAEFSHRPASMHRCPAAPGGFSHCVAPWPSCPQHICPRLPAGSRWRSVEVLGYFCRSK